VEDLPLRKLSFSAILPIDIYTIFVFDILIFDIFAFDFIRGNRNVIIRLFQIRKTVISTPELVQKTEFQQLFCYD